MGLRNIFRNIKRNIKDVREIMEVAEKAGEPLPKGKELIRKVVEKRADEEFSKFVHTRDLPLTENETTVLKLFFGDDLDTSIMRKNFAAGEPGDGIFPGDCSFMLFKGYDAPIDMVLFNSDSPLERFNMGLFFHVSAKIWQAQKGIILSKEDLPLPQDCVIGDPSFDNLHLSEQSWLIAAYAKRCRDGKPREAFANIANIIEARFPGAKEFSAFCENARKNIGVQPPANDTGTDPSTETKAEKPAVRKKSGGNGPKNP